jgi:diacylglycerol kinase (ATP)
MDYRVSIEVSVSRICQCAVELAGRAKDQGSAAVLLAMALVVLVWGALLWQKFTG